jgi:ketosteroid isomerase-like protein
VTATEQDVLAANAAFYAAFVARDMAAMEALWAQSVPVTCLHPGWNLLSGREDVLGSWRAIIGNPDQARIVAGGATVRLLGDAALVVCRELVGGNPLAATNVFIQEEGAWRLVHHQSGPVMQVD